LNRFPTIFADLRRSSEWLSINGSFCSGLWHMDLYIQSANIFHIILPLQKLIYHVYFNRTVKLMHESKDIFISKKLLYAVNEPGWRARSSSSSSVYRHLFSMSELKQCRGSGMLRTPSTLWWSQTSDHKYWIIRVGIRTNLIFPLGLNFLFHQNSLFITTNDNIWRMHLICGEEGGQNEF
jgi:hypothetical protein